MTTANEALAINDMQRAASLCTAHYTLLNLREKPQAGVTPDQSSQRRALFDVMLALIEHERDEIMDELCKRWINRRKDS